MLTWTVASPVNPVAISQYDHDFDVTATLYSIPTADAQSAWLRTMKQQITQRLANLDEIHNNLAPINLRLPDDVFASIFMCLRTVGGYPDLVAASGVCRRWRDAALKAPWLWDLLDIARPLDFLKLILERSKDLQLVVVASKHRRSHLHQGGNVRFVNEFFKKQPRRIRAVDLTACSDHHLDYIAYEMLAALPPIRFLALAVDQSPDGLMRSDPTCASLAGVLSRCASHLRTLQLEWICLPLMHASFPSLVTLELRRPSWAPSVLPIVTDRLIDFLEMCPSLETLVCENIRSFSPKGARPARRCVMLPRIKMISLVDMPVSASRILSCLRVLPNTAVKLELEPPHSSEVDPDPKTISGAVPWRRLANLLAIRRLEIAYDHRRSTLMVSGSHPGHDYKILVWTQYLQKDISRQLSLRPTFIPGLLEGMNANTLSQVKSLSLGGSQPSYSRKQWKAMLGWFPGVCDLTISWNSAQTTADFFEVMQKIDSPVPESTRRDWDYTYLCPSLQRLTISRIMVHGTFNTGPDKWIEEAVAFLRRRHSLKTPIKYLELNCLSKLDHRWITAYGSELKTLVDEFKLS